MCVCVCVCVLGREGGGGGGGVDRGIGSGHQTLQLLYHIYFVKGLQTHDVVFLKRRRKTAAMSVYSQ